MYKILITTTYNAIGGGCAVATEVVDFDTTNAAYSAISVINENHGLTYSQQAIALF